MILFPYILFEKYIHILALEMASPEKQHCANCIGTLLFLIYSSLDSPSSLMCFCIGHHVLEIITISRYDVRICISTR